LADAGGVAEEDFGEDEASGEGEGDAGDEDGFGGVDEGAQAQFNEEEGAEVPAGDGEGESSEGIDPGSE